MTYKLLTGATGLLGRYLLRDLLLLDRRVAVLVRPSRQETAEQRVDVILSHWENEWGRALPRPVILTGDITQPLLGLGQDDLAWIKRRCDSVLHSAASLTFYEKGGEPRRSNVDGVRKVLQLCREADIRVLEHVSSAYVCGLRSGRVYESELDAGQEFGNDYEKSKVAAEELVRADEHLQAFTIFRPSIIVGDSVTGYTSTFHGFYSPLRIAASLLTTTGINEVSGGDYFELLNLTGKERKNYVPVDWVSDAMVSIIGRAVPQNETYAMVSEHPVSVRRMYSVFAKAVRKHYERMVDYVDPWMSDDAATGGRTARRGPLSRELFHKAFVERFAVYRSYWRDDPDFDSSNTRSALPELPCPVMSDESLFMLCEYALTTNFGFPPPRYESPEFHVGDWIRTHGELYKENGAVVPSGEAASSQIGVTVAGAGGGCWTIHDKGLEPFLFSEGLNEIVSEARMTSNTFRDLVQGHTSLDDAVTQGRIVFFGDQSRMRQLESLVQISTGPKGAGGPCEESP